MTAWRAVRLQRRRDDLLNARQAHSVRQRKSTYLCTVRTLDEKLVLQHDKVTLSRPVSHELLEPRTEGIEKIARAGYDRFLREQSEPAQA